MSRQGGVQAPQAPQTSWLDSAVNAAQGYNPQPRSTNQTPQPGLPYRQGNPAQMYAESIYAPDQLALQQQALQLGREQEYQSALNALNQQGLYSTFNSQIGNLGLQEAGLGLDRQDLTSARGMLGLDREGLGVSRDYINQMMGVRDRDQASRQQALEQGLATDQQNTEIEYSSRGGWFTPKHRMDLADNYATAIRDMSDSARMREEQQYGFDRDLANIGLDDRRIDYKFRDLDTANQRLDLTAKKLGMDRADYETALNQGLAQLGLDGQYNAQTLADAMGTNNAQQAAMIQQIMQYAAMLSGNPTLMAMIAGQGQWWR